MKKFLAVLIAVAMVMSLIILPTSMTLLSNKAVVQAATTLNVSKWTEYVSNPVFGQGIGGLKAYYPSVVKVSDNDYRMWYDSSSGIGYATSTDGIHWTEIQNPVTDLTNPIHNVVIYDSNGFGGGSYNYKIWYLDKHASVPNGTNSIRYAESTDGIIWVNDQSVFGGNMVTPGDDNVDAPSRTWGPGAVIYNPSAINTGTNPMNYSYVMYYDGYDGNTDDSTWDKTEALFLAYSTNGINWNRYTRSPVFKGGLSGEWDNGGVGYPTVMKLDNGTYVMWYGGGSGTNKGIGFAYSSDGVNWVKDKCNPIMHKDDSISWRNNRTYTPEVIKDGNMYKMWFTGKDTSGNYSIGLATADGPFPSIQSAVDVAVAGDTINVAAGTYDEQVVIDKSLTLQGVGDTTIIKPSQATANEFQLFTRYGGGSTAGVIVANANGASVTVKDLKVDGELVTSTPSSAALIGIFYRETGGTIDNVTVEDVTVANGNGTYLSAETETVSVEVKNSTFANYQKNGITANGPTLTANIHDNTVTGRGPTTDCQNGIQLCDSKGTITGNTIINHSSTGTYAATGIFLNEAKSSTVSGNTLTDNEEGVALDYYTAGSGSGVTIDVNGGTITGGTYGICIQGDPTLGSDLTCNVGSTTAVTVDSASGVGIYVTQNVDLTLSNSTIKNTGSDGSAGIYIASDQCPVTIDDNTIQSNGGYGIMSYGLAAGTPNVLTITGNTITGSPTGIGSYFSTTTAHFNNIYGNTNYGVVNWDTTVLDAENNWWGDNDKSGPYHPTLNPGGTGDAVSNNVTFDPWIGEAETATEGAAEGVAGGTVEASSTETFENGTLGIGAKATTNSGGPSDVMLVKYSGNPTNASFTASFNGSYYDLNVTNPRNISEITMRLYYPASHGVLTPFWFNTSSGEWEGCSSWNDYAGYVAVTVNNSTTPSLSELAGTYLGLGGPYEVGGTVYPVNKAVLLIPWLLLLLSLIVGAIYFLRKKRAI